MAGLRIKARQTLRSGTSRRFDARFAWIRTVLFLGACATASAAWVVLLGRAVYDGVEWLLG